MTAVATEKKAETNQFIAQYKAARAAATPLIAIKTADPAATVKNIQASANGNPPPFILWDSILGFAALNDEGKEALTSISSDASLIVNATDALIAAAKAPRRTVIFFSNAQLYIKEPPVIQAIWNLRDIFKSNNRTLVMICPSLILPQELTHDVLTLDEPLPDVAHLRQIIADTYDSIDKNLQEKDASERLPQPKKEIMARAVDAICGLPAFPAEQACYMNMSKTGLNIETLWDRKLQMIEQTVGLSIWRGGERFDDIGGCANAKKFLRLVLQGEQRPRAIVFIDEIEKALAGTNGDTSGTSQEMLGALLSFMQDKTATGLLFIGPPGAAKSAMAKATGNEAEIPTISFDISGMKGSLVGESGSNMRAALKLVEAVSQSRALFIATCNSISSLPPELRRRFSFGTFFFDLPDREEREAIWKIYLKSYKLSTTQPRPNDAGWTGAEIKQACDLAWRLKCSLKDAALYIVPVSKSASDQIDRLRKMADGRFISASRSGVYEIPKETTDLKPKGSRSIDMED